MCQAPSCASSRVCPPALLPVASFPVPGAACPVTSAPRCVAPARRAALARAFAGFGPSSVTREAVGATRAADDTFAGNSRRRRLAPPAAGSPGTRAWGLEGGRAQPPRSGPAFQPAQHSARVAPGDAAAAKSPVPQLRKGTRQSPRAAARAAAVPASGALRAPPQLPAGGASGRCGLRGQEQGNPAPGRSRRGRGSTVAEREQVRGSRRRTDEGWVHRHGWCRRGNPPGTGFTWT